MTRIRMSVVIIAVVALSSLGVGVASATTAHHKTTHRATSHILRGPRGRRGPRGPRGIQGIQGVQGGTGPAGPPGNTTFTNYHATITTPGASSSSPATVTLATIGPFTVTGECFITTGSTAEAQTFVSTSQDHSALNDYESAGTVADFNVATGAEHIGESATGSQGTPDIEGPYDGSTSLISGDGTTFVNLFSGTGAYVGSGGGGTEPACTFYGFYDSY